MTRVARSAFTETEGVLHVKRVCNDANQVFREVVTRDVGIDGFLEVCEDGAPSGKLIGFQIKSGDGFLSEDGRTATFRADKPHFAYWATCHFPVIGVVYLPRLGKAVWLDLTEVATDARIVHGPHSEQVRLTRGNLFTRDTLLSLVITKAFAVVEGSEVRSERRPRPLTVQEARHLVEQGLPTGHEDLSGEEVWSQMIDVMLSMTSRDDVVAKVARELMFYYGAYEDQWPGDELRERVSNITDPQIVKLVRAANAALINNQEHVAGSVASIIGFVESPRARLGRLMKRRLIPPDVHWVARQILDVLE
ncbi:MAG: DUF4365 domain-containing protein [Planctomycetota bacterium]|nr:DUF4365 domain-containing protein [Planctomycetota bacterium]